MTSWQKICVIVLAALLATGCKDIINPHSTPATDPSRLVASMAAATNQAIMARAGAQVVLTINNAPEANQPLEQDFLTEVVELFEKQNPNIRIQYSPWQYTPESFFERLNNRTLTDIVEVDAAQMKPIIEANAAADLTENVKVTPEMRLMNPDVFTVTSQDGRTYGVPVELHTLALFYNRKLFDATKVVVPPATKKSEDMPKGKGAEGEPRDFLWNQIAAAAEAAQVHEPAMELAQYGRGAPYAYPPTYQPAQRPRRNQQEAQRYSNQPPRQSARQQQTEQQRQQEYYRQYYQQYYQQYPQYQQQQQQQQQEDARERRVRSRKEQKQEQEQEDASSRKRKKSSDDSTTSTESYPDDVLTSAAEVAMQERKTTASDAVTTVIRTQGLPQDLEQFVRLAVRLTDHKKGTYGFAPVLYAAEGGREYTQWCIEAGLDVQNIQGETVTLDIDKSGEVAQFLKDLHYRFDVTPPPTKSFYDHLMTLFAKGKLGMMIMPADGETVAELQKRGMSLADIGIAALPRGIANRDHLTYGRCMIINSQLDQTRRAAAFKWLMFVASPEVKRMRAQFFFREKGQTCEPSVPLYSPQMQAEFYASVRQYRSLPLWADYESIIASHLHLAPSFETKRFYETIAEGVRPILERKDSNPFHAVTLITSDFERKYIRKEKPDNLMDRYVNYLMEKDKN